MLQDTDSDVAEQRDGGKVKVKWTQEEVIVTTWLTHLLVVSMTPQLTKSIMTLRVREHKHANCYVTG